MSHARKEMQFNTVKNLEAFCFSDSVYKIYCIFNAVCHCVFISGHKLHQESTDRCPKPEDETGRKLKCHMCHQLQVETSVTLYSYPSFPPFSPCLGLW